MSNPTVTYPVNEVIGLCANTKAMLTKYKTQMIAAKVDPTEVIAKLDPDKDTLSNENDKQEGLKTQLRDQTKVVNTSSTTAYNDCSRGCDMVITAFGRQSEQAQEATNLRKGVRPVKHKDTTTPGTTPPAT
jgi:hypothetical protein